MFETSQPIRPDGSSRNSEPKQPRLRSEPVIKTLDQLTVWIEEQLVELEKRYQDFETKRSLRGYYEHSNR